MEPGAAVEDAFAFSTVGLRLGRPEGDNQFLPVADVFPDSPGEEVDIVTGDRLVAVNGTSVVSLGRGRVEERLSADPGSKITLTI